MKTPALIAPILLTALLAGCASTPQKTNLAAADCSWAAPPVVKIIVDGPGLIQSLVYEGDGALRYYPQGAQKMNAMGSIVVDCGDLSQPESCKARNASSQGFDEVGARLVGSFLRVQPIAGEDGRYDVKFVMLERAKYANKRCASPPISDMDVQV